MTPTQQNSFIQWKCAKNKSMYTKLKPIEIQGNTIVK